MASLRSPPATRKSCAEAALASIAQTLPKRAALMDFLFCILPPVSAPAGREKPVWPRSARDHDVIAFFAQADAQKNVGGARETFDIAGWKRGANRQLRDLRIGDDQFGLVVAVEFGRGFGKRGIVEHDN